MAQQLPPLQSFPAVFGCFLQGDLAKQFDKLRDANVTARDAWYKVRSQSNGDRVNEVARRAREILTNAGIDLQKSVAENRKARAHIAGAKNKNLKIKKLAKQILEEPDAQEHDLDLASSTLTGEPEGCTDQPIGDPSAVSRSDVAEVLGLLSS